MSEDALPSRSRKNQIATEQSVGEVCEALFREGSPITEIAVRKRLGGGSTPVIYRFIKIWEEHHRQQFLALEQSAVDRGAGQAPADMPPELWEALQPAWEQAVATVRRQAKAQLRQARDEVAGDRKAVEELREQVRDQDARWQAEKADWSQQISDLSTQLASAQGQIQAANKVNAALEKDHEQLQAQLQRLTEQAQGLQAALQAAEQRHEADQSRWALQIDTTRQEAKAAAVAAGEREQALREQLASATEQVGQLRIDLERARVEATERAQRITALTEQVQAAAERIAVLDRRVAEQDTAAALVAVQLERAQAAAGQVDPASLLAALESVEDALSETRRKLPAKKRAEMILTAYTVAREKSNTP